jgi:hypothetical protein
MGVGVICEPKLFGASTESRSGSPSAMNTRRIGSCAAHRLLPAACMRPVFARCRLSGDYADDSPLVYGIRLRDENKPASAVFGRTVSDDVMVTDVVLVGSGDIWTQRWDG